MTFPAFLRVSCGHMIKFGWWDIKGSIIYYSSQVSLREGGQTLFLPFLFHAGWNTDKIAGTHADILDYELEATCDSKATKKKPGFLMIVE